MVCLQTITLLLLCYSQNMFMYIGIKVDVYIFNMDFSVLLNNDQLVLLTYSQLYFHFCLTIKVQTLLYGLYQVRVRMGGALTPAAAIRYTTTGYSRGPPRTIARREGLSF